MRGGLKSIKEPLRVLEQSLQLPRERHPLRSLRIIEGVLGDALPDGGARGEAMDDSTTMIGQETGPGIPENQISVPEFRESPMSGMFIPPSRGVPDPQKIVDLNWGELFFRCHFHFSYQSDS